MVMVMTKKLGALSQQKKNRVGALYFVIHIKSIHCLKKKIHSNAYIERIEAQLTDQAHFD
jgi:hypothetical protein